MNPQHSPSLMAQEAAEAGPAIARQLAQASARFAELGERLRRLAPPFVVTCARGSSDHAATYGKYLIETTLGRPVASIGPSIASVYHHRLQLSGGLFVAVSQSGRSPDLLRLTEAARAGKALVVGFVNAMDSPLPALCDVCIPLATGPERSVAATKSCLASFAAFLQLVAHWQQDDGLLAQAAALPQALARAVACDWYEPLQPLAKLSGLFMIGRGLGLGAAMEMALKCKETSRLHAEAFSAAEVVHGPIALIGPDFPALALTQADPAAGQTRAVVERMLGMGAQVWLAGDAVPGATVLAMPPDLPAETVPLAALQSFYLAIDRIARDRGLNPDPPPELKKLTETT